MQLFRYSQHLLPNGKSQQAIKPRSVAETTASKEYMQIRNGPDPNKNTASVRCTMLSMAASKIAARCPFVSMERCSS